MSIIYGGFSLTSTNIRNKNVSSILRKIIWKDANHFKLEFGNFSGGIICNKFITNSKFENYHLSRKNELLILFSGAIYNTNDIRGEVNIGKNVKPPELISKLYSTFGIEFIKKLNGDFSFTIYDKKNNILFICCDHLGIRPIAYTKIEDGIYFSNDTFGLCKATNNDDNIDFNFILKNLISFGLSSTDLLHDYGVLPNKEVHRLAPACTLKFSKHGVSIKKYWHPERIKTNNKLNYNVALKELKEIVIDAIQIRCDSKYTASVHVSGGLDSGIVANIVKKEYHNQKSFFGISWTPEHAYHTNLEFDESGLARSIFERSEISPIFIDTNEYDWNRYISNWRSNTDLFYEEKVREIARKKGINLIFSGFGGDEFLSINDFGVDSDLIFNFQWLSFLKKYPLSKPKRTITALLYKVILPAFSLLYYSKKRPIQSYSKYLKIHSRKKLKTINNLFSWKSRRDMHLRFLNSNYILERTEDWFINGYPEGIEYRYPLTDKRIIEYMFKIPSKLLFRDGCIRTLIRDIGEGILPEDVRWNKSKNDPVRVDQIYKTFDKASELFMNEIPEFKLNPLFKIIDFDLLELDIEKYRKGLIKKRPSEQFEILFFLKKTHEFSKAYFN